jgi:gamma-glutamyltranspeptidase/glutathione hydrolase
MNWNLLQYPYPSRRNVICGTKGMVATSHPLAAQAGLDMLKQGGNAVDAAVAAATCLTVVEPPSNGVGGDAFSILYIDGRYYGFNSSGPAPAEINADAVRKMGHASVPQFGWTAVTVPGAPAAWVELSRRFGQLPLTQVMTPAVEFARNGHAVAPTVSKYWAAATEIYKKELKQVEFAQWAKTFTAEGRIPAPGELWRCGDLGDTLQEIAETEAESFYKGDLAEKIEAYSRKTGGFLRLADLQTYKPEWVDPLSTNYRGYDVWELPPNGQGMVVLMALNILKGFELSANDINGAYHRQIEALKLALATGLRCITDPAYMNVSVEDLLSDQFAADARKRIKKTALSDPHVRTDPRDTVYVAAVDRDGNMVSYIQSNFVYFGSGIVIPGTGISLQNRGYSFSLDEKHANYLEPGKRPYHTIIPGFLSRDDVPIGPFGIIGGLMQTQAHLQVLVNSIDFGMNPQAALDAPRWQWLSENEIVVEPTFPEEVVASLRSNGHRIHRDPEYGGYGRGFFGRGQIIWKTEKGVLVGGTDPRTDGYIAVY